MLKRIINFRSDEKILRHFFANTPKATQVRGRVLLYVGISSTFLTPLEILIYHLLKQKGFEVDYLVYDGSIPIYEHVTKESENPKNIPRKTWRYGKSRLKAAKVPYQNIPVSKKAKDISDSVSGLNSALNFQLDGINFGHILHGSLCRYYKSTEFGDDALCVAKQMLITALSNYFCAQNRQKVYGYELMMFSHGINITWEPVAEFCRQQNVNFVCYDRAKVKEHGNFTVNKPSPDWDFSKAWQRFGSRKLKNEEIQQANKYLKERELQKGDVFAFNASERSLDIDIEKQKLGIPPEKKCITFFSNLIWDAANINRDIAFTSFLECIINTINHYKNQAEIHILIRPHPAESLIGTSAGYWNLILSHFGDRLPSNVTVIPATANVNSFTVIDMTDVGVVNTSTVGLEMAILGKPTLLVAETHYRDKGFTYDVNSREHFFESLELALKQPKLNAKQQQLAKKYFYMMMFLYQKHLPVRYENGKFTGYSSKTFNELKRCEPLMQIIDCLTEELPDDFVWWPEKTNSENQNQLSS